MTVTISCAGTSTTSAPTISPADRAGDRADAAGGFYGLSDAICLVGRQVVHEDDVAGREGRHENLLEIGPESHSIHRPVKDHRRDPAGEPERPGERRSFPMMGVGRPLPALMCQSGGVDDHSRKTSTTEVSTIGLAKNIFEAHGANAAGNVVFRRKLRREEVLAFFASEAPCLVAMEASSHQVL